MQKTKTLLAVPLVLALLPATPAGAAEAAGRAAAVTPYLDEQTITVGRLDLDRVDVAAVLQQFLKIVRPPNVEPHKVAKIQATAEKWIADMKRAGGHELYLVVSLADVTRTAPFVVVPVRRDGDPRAVAGLLFGGRADGPTKRQEEPPIRHFLSHEWDAAERFGGAVVLGDHKTLQRLREQAPAKRPGLAGAFAAAGDTDLQFLILPSEDHRRVFREIRPQLPSFLGGGSSGVLADGLYWAAAGIDLPPKPAVQLVVQSKDAFSAEALKRGIDDCFGQLRQFEPARKRIPTLDELLDVLEPTVADSRLTIRLDRRNNGVARLLAALPPVVAELIDLPPAGSCVNNLKMLGLALHNYLGSHRAFPAAASYGKDGKKLLSWRVHVLPFLEEGEELYRQFHLDEPWDSEHNRKLIAKMPNVFACPEARLHGAGKTTYLVPLGPKTVFSGKEGAKIADIKDGTAYTLLLLDVAAKHAVIWTKPDDWPVDLDNPLRGLVGQHGDTFLALRCDGSAHTMRGNIAPKTLRALFTRAAGDAVKD